MLTENREMNQKINEHHLYMGVWEGVHEKLELKRELGNIWQRDVPNDFATLGNIEVEAT